VGAPTDKRTRRALGAAWRALDEAFTGRPLAAALSDAMRADGDLGPREKKAAAGAARGVLRELRRIDLALSLACETAGVPLKSVSSLDRTVLRYLALRVSVERESPARVLPELRLPNAPRSCSLGDPKLVRIAAALPAADLLPLPDDPLRAVALRRSVPDVLARRLADELGLEKTDALLAALNRPARWDLRVNRLVATREEAQARLLADGVTTRFGTLSPDALVTADRTGLFGAAHAAGVFELQDEGSQLIALACGARPGETVLDLCAGSGGKSLALAADVGKAGKVLACDAVRGRLNDLPERVRRAHAGGIVEAAGVEPDGSWRGRVDAVLVDAPCSGLGSMRREVDLRWRTSEKTLDAFPPLQLEILRRAASFVRPGGRLVYATCSPLRAENEGVVAAFLASEPGFTAADLATTLPASAHAAVAHGVLRTWPDRDDTGAFFAALLLKTA
jgi:16S rRNA (cytosine967-C5)-methyltransferase